MKLYHQQTNNNEIILRICGFHGIYRYLFNSPKNQPRKAIIVSGLLPVLTNYYYYYHHDIQKMDHNNILLLFLIFWVILVFFITA